MSTIEKLRTLTQKALIRFNFSSADYWELRYKTKGNSGVGSYGEKCEVKAEKINKYIKDFNIKSVVEFGCGDGNQLGYYKIPSYVGLDVSPTTIQNCHQIFKDDITKTFIHYNPKAFYNNGGNFKADATFSIEVIFHLVEDSVYLKYMNDLFSCAGKYVIIFSSNHNNNEGCSVHVKHHKFTDYVDAHQKNWKLILKEPVHTKAEGHFNDFYIFEKIN